MFTLSKLQREQYEWIVHQPFGGPVENMHYSVIGLMQILMMADALGKIAHSHLKQMQNIRGNKDKHELDAKKGIQELIDAAFVYDSVRIPVDPPIPYRTEGLKALLGVIEETGELAKAMLAQENEELTKTVASDYVNDAIADIVIFLVDIANRRGINLDNVVEHTWNKVKDRDWNSKSEF